jgi:tRNA-binding protein
VGEQDRLAHGSDAHPDRVHPKDAVEVAAFAALDLRVGDVIDVQPFPEARDPAWRLWVDFGPDLGVLATSAKITNYPREDLVGRQVVGAVNLGSRRIAGFDSQFLVLGGLAPDGTVHLLGVDGVLPAGAVIA